MSKKPPKKAISLIGGAVSIATGLRDLRKNKAAGKLATIHVLLKITVAVVGVIVALKAADEAEAEADAA